MSTMNTPNDQALATVLLHKRVDKTVAAVLRTHGFKKEDLEEGIAEVRCRAIEWARKPGNVFPSDPAEAAKVCATIAKNWRIDEDRKRKTREPHDAGLCDEPDEHGPAESPPGRWDPFDVKRTLASFREQVAAGEMPEDIERIVVGIAEGKTTAEIADELGLSEDAVKMRLRKTRGAFRAKVAALGLLTLALMCALFVVLPLGGIAVRDGSPDQADASTHPSHIEAPARERRAGGRTPESCDAGDCNDEREMEAKPRLR